MQKTLHDRAETFPLQTYRETPTAAAPERTTRSPRAPRCARLNCEALPRANNCPRARPVHLGPSVASRRISNIYATREIGPLSLSGAPRRRQTRWLEPNLAFVYPAFLSRLRKRTGGHTVINLANEFLPSDRYAPAGVARVRVPRPPRNEKY